MFCILADRLDCAELLLKAGTQVSKTDKGGRTAIHWAAHKVRNKKEYIDWLSWPIYDQLQCICGKK
jgi:ankyrin repeat protein